MCFQMFCKITILIKKTHHNDCIYIIYLQNVFSNAISDHISLKKPWHICCIAFFLSVYFKIPYKMNILQKALSHSLAWHGSSPVWVHICKSKIHWNISQCVIWYNLHFNNCFRVKWFAPITHWNSFLLWFVQDKFTFMLHWNNNQDISKYL